VHFVGPYYICNLNSEEGYLQRSACRLVNIDIAPQERLASIISVEKHYNNFLH